VSPSLVGLKPKSPGSRMTDVARDPRWVRWPSDVSAR
jgi:hypothetical protein